MGQTSTIIALFEVKYQLYKNIKFNNYIKVAIILWKSSKGHMKSHNGCAYIN